MTATSLFLLTGEDTWQQRHYLQELVEQSLDPEWRTFNLESFNGEDIEASKLLENWLTPPFWGERRLIQAEFRTTETLNNTLGTLAAYLTTHTPETPNLMILIATSVDKRRKEVKSALKWFQHHEFPAIKPWNFEKELYPWIEQAARRKGKRIARQAQEILAHALGADKHSLEQTLDKLVTFLGPEPQIEAQHVRTLVTKTEADIFGFLEALAHRHTESALLHLHQQLLRDNPESIIASLAANLRMLYRARQLQHQQWSLDDIARETGQHAFRLKKNLELWHAYSLSGLEKGLRALLATQTQLHQGMRLSPTLALELWIQQFTQNTHTSS
jgi:DNA polymerase III delta subunit